MLAAATFLLALATVPFLGLRWFARRVAETDAPLEDRLHRIGRAQLVAFLALPFVAVIGAIGLGVIGRAETLTTGLATAVSLPDPLAAVVAEAGVILAIFGVVALPVVAGIAGAYPTVRRLRDTSASSWRVLKGTLIGLGFVVAVVAGWIGLLTLAPEAFTDSPLLLVVLLGLFVSVLDALAPYTILLTADRVPLEGERRERVERCCDAVGFTPRAVSLLEGESTKAANAMLAGTIPGRRYVFLTDYLLAEADDDQLRAILAHEYGHVAGRHLVQQTLATVATFGVFVVLLEYLHLEGLGDGIVGVAAIVLAVGGGFALYYYVVLGAISLYHEYAADRFAARVAGATATVEALELLAEANDARRDTGLLYALAAHHPSFQDRIDAVQEGNADRSARARQDSSV